ncbi:unnamed protein product [Ectocarpus fasciculatus]
MACEARIIRALRTMEYPGLGHVSGSAGTGRSLVTQPHELAKIVGWIEDRKVRGLAISDREPLRTPGPKWEAAFFSYLQEMGCPNDLKATGGGAGESSSAVLRGVSWLVTEAVACDFEDNGTDYKAAARELLSANASSSPQTMGGTRDRSNSSSTNHGSGQPEAVQPTISTTGDAMDVGPGGENRKFREQLRGFTAGVETGDEACDSVATVLRMLYLSDLRSLQDEVNGVIALAQSTRREQNNTAA